MDDSGRRLKAHRDPYDEKRGWYVVDELRQTDYLRMDGTVRDAVQDRGGVNAGWWPSKKSAKEAIANYYSSLEAPTEDVSCSEEMVSDYLDQFDKSTKEG